MMTTFRTPVVLDALMSRSLLLDGRSLQRRSPVLHVDGELDTLARVPLDEGVSIFLQRLGELVERQPIGRLAALLLRSDEIVEDAQPLRWLGRGFARGLREDLGRNRAHHGGV